jgi:hypothetical protein
MAGNPQQLMNDKAGVYLLENVYTLAERHFLEDFT